MSKVVSVASVELYRWRWLALALLLIAEAMNLLDSTIVQVAAPVIHAELAGPDADIQWFSAAYTLPFALLLITGGRLGDIVGRKQVFRVGVVGFVLASAGCALAPSSGLLIAARAIQGAAAALIIPQTFGLIRAMFDGDELAKALGSIGPVMGLSAVCGPLLGAVLTHANLLGSSWRAAFLINVPLGVAVLIAAPLLREDRAADRPGLDLPGTLLAVTGAGLVIYPLIEGNAAGWPAWTWGALVAGLAVLVLFGLHQRRCVRQGRTPLVEPSLFENRGFPAALVSSVLCFSVMNGLMLVIMLQLQLGLHADVLVAGLSLLPWSCGLAVASWVAGSYLVPRFGFYRSISEQVMELLHSLSPLVEPLSLDEAFVDLEAGEAAWEKLAPGPRLRMTLPSSLAPCASGAQFTTGVVLPPPIKMKLAKVTFFAAKEATTPGYLTVTVPASRARILSGLVMRICSS